MTKSFEHVFSMAKQYAEEIKQDGHGNSSKWLLEAVEEAAAYLARLQRIEQAYIKAAMYAEELLESKDDEIEYWGQRFYKALDAAALKE